MGFCTFSLVYIPILATASLGFGSIIAYGSGTLKIIKVTFGPLSTFYVGAFQAAPAFAAIFAPLLWNFLIKRFRLKICASILGFSGLVFWLLLLTMNKQYFWVTILIRGLLGITLAGCSAITPLYLARIAPENQKGFYTTLHCAFIIIGHIVINLLGVTHKWQPPIYINAAFLFILGSLIYLVPDDIDLKKIETTNEGTSLDLTTTDSQVDDEQPKLKIFDKKIVKQTIICALLLFLLQFSGIGSIMQNLSPLMSEVGLDIEAGYQATVAICAQLIPTFFSSFLIDRWGCRFLWNLSAFGSGVSLLLYSLNIKFEWSKWLPMVFLFCFQFFFGCGTGSVPWIYPSKVLPEEVRSAVLALGTSSTWLAATIVMFLFPYLQDWFGQFGLMLILSGVSFLNFIIGLIFVHDYHVDEQGNLIKENKTNNNVNTGNNQSNHSPLLN